MYKSLFSFLLVVWMLPAMAQKRNAANSLNEAAGSAAPTGGNFNNNKSSGGGSNVSNTSRVMEIKIPEGGANGGAVVYHPREKLYYAAQTGNKEFPLVIFKEGGNVVSSSDQAVMMDIRGLWYNTKTKEIGGNGYAQFGWFKYELNKNGIPSSIDNFKTGRWQPDDHSAGVYNFDDNEVLFLSGMNIECYNTEGSAKNKIIRINPGQKSADDGVKMNITDFEINYNFRSIIYTGYKGTEIGLLNVTKKQVELYDIKTGYLTRIVKLPLSFTPEKFFNFSFSNDTYWVFNKATRHWNGFREE
jgi:hypothetical protein